MAVPEWPNWTIYFCSKISFTTTLRLGCLSNRVLARLGIYLPFFYYKQMAFLFHIQLLFLFSKHLDTMANVTDCGYGKTDFWYGSNLVQSWLSSEHHFCFTYNYCFYFQNIWIQWRMWRIVGMVKLIFDMAQIWCNHGLAVSTNQSYQTHFWHFQF